MGAETSADKRAVRTEEQQDRSTEDDAGAPAAVAFRMFARLWAAGVLFHMASYGESPSLTTIPLAVTACLVLARPAVLPFVGVLALHLLYVVERLPHVPNHAVFGACADLTMLAAAFGLAVRGRWSRVEPGALFRSFAPIVRLELVLFYGFVVFHKLNWGFFDLDTGCGAVMYARLAGMYQVFPQADWARMISTALSVGIETLIPVMLLVGRWRLAGLIVAFTFHFLLSMDPGDVIFNFSAMLIALYFLFLPEECASAIRQVLQPIRNRWARTQSAVLPRFVSRAAVYAVAPAVFAAIIFRRTLDNGLTAETGRVLWVAYALFVLITFLRAMAVRRWRPLGFPGVLAPAQPALLLFPALLVLNGCMPYLGGKTETSFAMFSNLRTEGGVSNHILVPASWQIWDYQRDLVAIRHTSVADIQEQADKGWLWTYFEFRSLMHRYPDASITFERAGVVTTLARAHDDPELARPDDALSRKLLRFRKVPVNPSPAPCIH
jgi:hypothetical protein